MNDFWNIAWTGSETADVGTPGPGGVAPGGVAPGKTTLTQSLRGLHGAPAPEGIAPPPQRGLTSTLPAGAGADPFDFTFGDAGRGLKGGPVEEGEFIRGGPSGGDGGVDGGGAVPATAPPAAVTITSTTNAGPTFGPRGATMWHVAFTTTGRTGWIVQHITNTVSGTLDGGTAITLASIGLTGSYYEGWNVSASGALTPTVGGDNDHWDQGPFPLRSKGRWSTAATLHWIAGAPTPAGMAARNVANAGDLVSSIAAPPGLGSSLLARSAHGEWDSTVTPNVDTGGAA